MLGTDVSLADLVAMGEKVIVAGEENKFRAVLQRSRTKQNPMRRHRKLHTDLPVLGIN